MDYRRITSEEIESVLALLLEGQLSHEGTDVIFHAALGHARGYIRWMLWQRNYSLVPLGMSSDDVAIDAIAELLSEIDGERMERLRSALRDVRATERVEGLTLALAFKAVVLRTVRFNLARVFAEIHPVRARVLRSLRRFVHGDPRYTRHDGLAGYWYSFADRDPHLEFPAAPVDALRAVLAVPHHHAHPAARVLTTLLEALTAFPSLRQAVAEEDVLDLTLQLLQADQIAASPETSESTAHTDGDTILAEALAVLETLRPWMQATYVDRGKLGENEAAAMLHAAGQYIGDLARGEDRGHYHYLHALLPELTHGEYRARYRNMYEYMLRNIFTTLRDRLQLSFEEQEDFSATRGSKSS